MKRLANLQGKPERNWKDSMALESSTAIWMAVCRYSLEEGGNIVSITGIEKAWRQSESINGRTKEEI
jgi:hypothetical protein